MFTKKTTRRLSPRPTDDPGVCQGCGKQITKRANVCGSRCAKFVASRWASALDTD